MGKKTIFSMKGITLIELMIALVIGAVVVAGIYRLFVGQTRAYTVQEHVAEVQQSVRSAMEIILRDLRMAGYDDDNVNSTINILNPIVVYPADNSHVTVNYEFYNTTTIPPQYETRSVDFIRNAGAVLLRTLTITPAAGVPSSNTEPILENVDALNFIFGVDTNEDGGVDIWFDDPADVGTAKVVALRVLLTARPDQTNPDVKTMVSPRTLESIVTLRNQSLIR